MVIPTNALNALPNIPDPGGDIIDLTLDRKEDYSSREVVYSARYTIHSNALRWVEDVGGMRRALAAIGKAASNASLKNTRLSVERYDATEVDVNIVLRTCVRITGDA